MARAETPATDAEQYAQTIRGQLHLESDLDYIRSLESDSSLDTGEIGPPVTAAELRTLTNRRANGSLIRSLQPLLQSVPGYGGIWFSQTGDGIINVGYTGSALSALKAIVDTSGIDQNIVHFTEVETDASSLNNSTKLTTKLMQDSSLTVCSASVLLDQNALEVTLSDPSKEGQIAEALGSPSFLRFKIAEAPDALASRDITSGLLYGGEWLYLSNNSGCSVGYSNLRNSAGERYAVTAGHCGPNGTTVKQGKGSDGRSIGSIHAGSYGKSGTCDCGYVGPLASGLATNSVLVTNNAKYAYGSVEGGYEGESACHTGAASYESNGGKIVCGTITSVNTSVNADGTTTSDAIYWGGTAIHGDSGAPLGHGKAFLGIVTAGNGRATYFSKSTNIGAGLKAYF